MICPTCHGSGRIERPIPPAEGRPVFTFAIIPCPDCNGCGIGSCCGDAVSQPSDEGEG